MGKGMLDYCHVLWTSREDCADGWQEEVPEDIDFHEFFCKSSNFSVNNNIFFYAKYSNLLLPFVGVS